MAKIVGTPFQKGNKGRKKGSVNKLTKSVRGTVLYVFNKLQDDPKNNLIAFAGKYPRDFYTIAAKLIPTELTGAIDAKINLHIVRGKSNIKQLTSGTESSTD